MHKVAEKSFTYAWFLHLACHHRKLHGHYAIYCELQGDDAIYCELQGHDAIYCEVRKLVQREPLKGPKEPNS